MPTSDEITDVERMLVDEGLELLAAYRSIADSETRRAMREMVVALADAGRSGGGTPQPCSPG